MKKFLCLSSILVTSLGLSACSNNNSSAADRDHNASNPSNQAPEQPKEDRISDTRIKLTFNDKEVLIRMYDNPASMAFLAQLPLTVIFEDYIGKEKISILQKDYQQMMYKPEIYQKKATLLITLLGAMLLFFIKVLRMPQMTLSY